VAHCGHAAGEHVLDLLERFPNLYGDLAPVVAEPVILPPARVAGLAHKLLYGSDAPNVAIRAEASLARIRGLGLAAAAERQILGGTARSLEQAVKVG
jgi:predicted TIM-barrel fold metal-dependent hydrolase